ncbi:MAG: 50S ribosomal protein L22 [Actinomycetota bacterium]
MATEQNAREGRAVAKWLRTSPIKARRAADIIRGKPLMEARRLLAFTPIKGARLVSKVMESAVANATHNFDLPEDRLYVHRAFVDEGIRIKRWIPRAYGRANRIHKPTAHVTVIVRAHDIEGAPVASRPGGR